jgi:hypothetical protein
VQTEGAIQRTLARLTRAINSKEDAMMKRLNRPPVILAALVLFYLLPAALEAQPVTTSVQVPLAGPVFVPLINGSLDQVNLLGMVHVQTYFNPASTVLHPTDPMRISINLDQVSGVGDLTGLTYTATEVNWINFPTIPTDPMNLTFDLRAVAVPDPQLPTDPIIPTDPVFPLDISFLLTFNPDTGALINVDIESMHVPLP